MGTRREPSSVVIAQLGLRTTERRAAKMSTSARQTTAAVTARVNASTRWDPLFVAIAQMGMSTTERRAAKTSTSARKTTAPATANAHAPTRRDPSSVKIAKLGTVPKERRAADTITRARKTIRRTRARVTTAAATLNAHAPTTGEPRNVTVAQLAMSTTERRAANLFAELPTRYATNPIPRSGWGSPMPTPTKSA